MSARILKLVTLGSKTGRYGGPFDTNVAQCDLMAEAGFDVRFVTGVIPGDEPDLDAVGWASTFVPVRRWLPSRGFTSLFSLKMLKTLWAEVGAADVAYLSVAREAIPLVALVIARMRRVPLVIQTHGMLTSRTSRAHRAVDLLVRPLITSASAVVALTSREAEELVSWAGRRTWRYIAIIGNPIPITDSRADELALKSRRPEAVFIARLHPRKRVADFIGAAEFAHQNGWTERYVVVGPDQGELPLVLEAVRTNPLLTYEGSIPGTAVADRVASAGVFVLPSESEPWGNVLATAVAVGVPAVVTRSTALAETIESARLGIVVPDKDWRGIAEAVHLVVGSDEWSTRPVSRPSIFRRAAISEHLVSLLATALLERRDDLARRA